MGHSNGHGDPLAMALPGLRSALAELHRKLVGAVQRTYEAEHGRVSGPGELLQLLTQHPQFAWLRQLSELIADLDALAPEPPTLELGAEVRAATEALVQPGDEPGPFWKSYSPLLQDSPEVAVAHGQVRRLLLALPAATPGGARKLRARHQQALAKRRK